MELFDFDDLEEKQPCDEGLIEADEQGVARGRCLKCSKCSKCVCKSTGARDLQGRCGGCDCRVEAHENLTPWLQSLYARQVAVLAGPSYSSFGPSKRISGDPEDGSSLHIGKGFTVKNPVTIGLPMIARTRWRCIEADLFVHTDGRFHPQKDGRMEGEGVLRALPANCDADSFASTPALRDAANSAVRDPDSLLVSVICPTMSDRQPFHPVLYECFQQQAHPCKELVVIETGLAPSEFFRKLARSDRRIVYRFYLCTESQQWPVGLKRNIGCYLARGHVIMHFDDDDLYGPKYVSGMLKVLLGSVKFSSSRDVMRYAWQFAVEAGDLPPAAATLAAWHVLDLSDSTFGFLDAESDPELASMKDAWVYGWGFSFAYTKSAWNLSPFAEVTHAEDYEFMAALRKLSVPIALPREELGAGNCAHTFHPMVNTSGGEFNGQVRAGIKCGPLPALDALQTAVAKLVPRLNELLKVVAPPDLVQGLSLKTSTRKLA